MGNKSKYRKLCATEKSIPIFSRDWWLDAVCGEENWDVIIIEKGDFIVASLPYMKGKLYGFNTAGMPILTQKLGPWIKYPDGQKYSTKLEYEKKLFQELMELLPKDIAIYSQNFDYSITNWLPFYWKGFKQTSRYTYVIEELSDFEKIKGNLSHSKRQNLKKAEKSELAVLYDLPAEQFYKHHVRTLSEQNVYEKKIVYTYETFKRIYDACYKHRAGRVIYAKDKNENIHAALFVIWDENSAYDLISTIDSRYRKYGSGTLLVWKIMEYLSNKTKKFDFEGSMIEGVEKSFRGFGATQKMYFSICKVYDRKLAILMKCKEIVNLLRGR